MWWAGQGHGPHPRDFHGAGAAAGAAGEAAGAGRRPCHRRIQTHGCAVTFPHTGTLGHGHLRCIPALGAGFIQQSGRASYLPCVPVVQLCCVCTCELSARAVLFRNLPAFITQDPAFDLVVSTPRPTMVSMALREDPGRAGWSYKKSGKLEQRREGKVTVYGVPYSEHSSFPELRDCVARCPRMRQATPTPCPCSTLPPVPARRPPGMPERCVCVAEAARLASHQP